MKSSTMLPMMPTTPLAMFDVWKAGLMAFELWTTSLSTITMRNHLWQTQPFFSPNMMKENQKWSPKNSKPAWKLASKCRKRCLTQ